MPNRLLDTQLVSYAMQGWLPVDVDSASITSVTAQELLLMQGDSPTRNRYYVPLLSTFEVNPYIRRHKSYPGGRLSERGKRWTDRIILDFNNDHPTVIEYSHRAVANAINNGWWELLRSQASVLGRQRLELVTERLAFVGANQIRCVPLVPESAEIGLQLLADFSKQYSLKSRFRNSLNDMLGLAIAVHQGEGTLDTADQLLARFAKARLGADISVGSSRSRVNFSGPAVIRRENHDAKGYINRPWRAWKA